MDLSKKGKISIDEFKKFFHHSHYDRLLILGFDEAMLAHLPKEDLIIRGGGAFRCLIDSFEAWKITNSIRMRFRIYVIGWKPCFSPLSI